MIQSHWLVSHEVSSQGNELVALFSLSHSFPLILAAAWDSTSAPVPTLSPHNQLLFSFIPSIDFFFWGGGGTERERGRET